MAGSRLLPLALAVLLLMRPRDSSVVLVVTGVAFSVFWERGTGSENTSPESTTVSSTSSSESTSVSFTSSPDSPLASTSPSLEVTSTPDSSSSSTGANSGSPFPEPETASLPSSGSPGSEPTTISQFTSLLPQGSPTVSSPSQDADSLWIPTSHRNPGVVIAVCLLVSVLLVGSVLTAVRHCNRDAAAFQNLDTVSMGSVSQRLPFADHLRGLEMGWG
ncbi:uncharacterized serine-rich protein C1E8.05-like [Arvicola amphibius]|uniref:uncharacterized serine-rich protein C1E8.05-like n=1 Tax=Arvicola amphibius TaxID=1047088 RepID=UPI001C08F288|nr:uncharacterized serine-rich protein C1E8.05-like [Arvicola amphibius]